MTQQSTIKKELEGKSEPIEKFIDIIEIIAKNVVEELEHNGIVASINKEGFDKTRELIKQQFKDKRIVDLDDVLSAIQKAREDIEKEAEDSLSCNKCNRWKRFCECSKYHVMVITERKIKEIIKRHL